MFELSAPPVGVGTSMPAPNAPRMRITYIWTAKHVGNLDLLRACLADPELKDEGWVEEPRDEAEHGQRCGMIFVDRWVSIPGAKQLDYKQLAGWNIIVSRMEGMTLCADKAAMERALARCRDLGMPGYGEASAPSYFPPTWRLPEQLKSFKRHMQARRLEAPGPRASAATATWIVKPSDGSEGENIKLIQEERSIPACACVPRLVLGVGSPAAAHPLPPSRRAPLIRERESRGTRPSAVPPIRTHTHSLTFSALYFSLLARFQT